MQRITFFILLAFYSVPAAAQFVENPKLSVTSLYYEGELKFLRQPALESIAGIIELEFRNISDQPISQIDLASDGLWKFKSVKDHHRNLKFVRQLTPIFDNRREPSTLITITLPQPLLPRAETFLAIEFVAVYSRLATILKPQVDRDLVPEDIPELIVIVRLGQIFPMPALVKENRILLDYEFKHAPFFFDLTTPFPMVSTSMNTKENKFSSYSDGTSITYRNGKAISRKFSYNSTFLKKPPRLMFMCPVHRCRGKDVAEKLLSYNVPKGDN